MVEKPTYEELEKRVRELEQAASERNRAEKMLRDSEKRYRELVEMLPEAVFETDLKLKLTFANRNAFELFGYSKEDMSEGLNGLEMFVPEDRDRVKENFTKRLKGEIPGTLEYQALKKDGSIFPVLFNASSIMKEGELFGLRGIIIDITERMRIKEELKESEARLKKAQSVAKIGYWEYDLLKEEIWGSEEAFVIYGIERTSPLLPLDKVEACIPDASMVNKALVDLLQENKKYDIEYEICRENSGKSAFIHSLAELILKDDIPIKVLGIIQDVTEQKKAEEALRESEEQYRLLAETTRDIILLHDMEGRITYVNEAGLNFAGFDRAEAMAGSISDFIPADQLSGLVARGARRADGDEQTYRYETEFVDADGQRIPVDVNSTPALREGKVSGILIVARDITERKRVEKEQEKLQTQLVQTQKMESIGTLAGGIAHDFNNILFPIIGHTELLLEDVPGDSPLRESLNQVFTAAMRARDLVKQILTFSRQDGNEIKLMKIQPVIKEALKLIRSTIPTFIGIKQDISNTCGIIEADPTQIHQVIMNLCTNAYHAMEETGGELKVTLKEIELGEYDLLNPDMEPGPYACLTVADTGTGIDKSVRDKIFDPFFTTKELGKGTGMGLSVIHGIVHKAGGSVHVYSELGKGTEFHVYLPVVKSSSEQQVIQTKEPIQVGTERILLVDDEEAIAFMEKRMLERLGYSVVSRTSSVEALAAFRADPDKFDAVITDMAMPNMSGDKLASELIKIRPGIPILFCTGFSERISKEKAKALGIKGYLMKPIVMKDLSKKIRDVLDNK
jgi:PAS domain S-box-containing protein